MDINYYKSLEPFFGSWYIKDLIGEGSFGSVFEIEKTDEVFNKKYTSALKIISIPQNKSEVDSLISEGMTVSDTTTYFKDIVRDVINEYDLMSKLKGNSYIVSCEDYMVLERKDSIGWDILIRMELLTPFVKYISNKTLDEKEIVKLGIDLCNAIESCSKYNIIHRDIKPENIFVSEFGQFKLGDFGIARTAEKTSSAMSKKGTYTYMAPEVYKGNEYGKTVDIYSIGIVLYRLLNNNRAPFLPAYPNPISYASKEEALVKRMNGEVILPPALANPKLASIIMKACVYRSEGRYQNASEMKKYLEDYLAEISVSNDIEDEKTVAGVDEDRTVSVNSFSESKDDNEATVSFFAHEDKIKDSPKQANEIKQNVEATNAEKTLDNNIAAYEKIIENDTPALQKKSSSNKEEKKSNNGLKLIVFILAIVIIVAIVVAILEHEEKLKSGKNKNRGGSSNAQVETTANDNSSSGESSGHPGRTKDELGSYSSGNDDSERFMQEFPLSSAFTIELRDEGSRHYCVVEASVIVTTSGYNYENEIYRNENLIKQKIVEVISKYSYEEVNKMNLSDIQDEINRAISNLGMDYINKVILTSYLLT